MLYGAETWAETGQLEDILKSCYRRMLRYMAGERWQDRISSGKKMWFENETGHIEKEKVAMVWLRENGNKGRSVEINGSICSVEEKGSRKTKKNLKRYSEERFGAIREWLRMWHWIEEDGERLTPT